MDLVSYGVERCIDVAAALLLRFGLKFVDRLFVSGSASVNGRESGVRVAVVDVPMEDVGEPGAVAGAVVVIGAGVVVVGTAGHAPKEEQISSGGVFTKSSMIWGNSTCTKILQANGPPGNRSPSASQILSNAAIMSAIVASSSNIWSISVMMYLQMSHRGPWTF